MQLTLNGLAVGCIYGLVALGFVLIYKATELVNFAQGDLLMLGAFVAYMAVVLWGLDYWVGFLIAVVVIAAFGAVLDMTVLRRVIGQPQFAVVMLTIGLGAIFRTFASVTWGSEIYTLPTPFSGVTNIAGVTLSHQYLSIIAGTLILCSVLYAFFKYTRIGIAMQATSQNQLAAYYMGIPVKTDLLAGVGDLSGGGDGRRHFAGTGDADRHQYGTGRSTQGLRCCRARAASARSPARWWAGSPSA